MKEWAIKTGKDRTGPCDMLLFEDDKAICMLQKYFGWEVKPRICRNFFCDKVKNSGR